MSFRGETPLERRGLRDIRAHHRRFLRIGSHPRNTRRGMIGINPPTWRIDVARAKLPGLLSAHATTRNSADDIQDTTCLCVFSFSQTFALFAPALHPAPPIARLSPFVNCFRLTDWWMNRSIDLTCICTDIMCLRFIGAASSSSSSFPPLHTCPFVFSFSHVFVRQPSNMQPPLVRVRRRDREGGEREGRENRDREKIGNAEPEIDRW